MRKGKTMAVALAAVALLTYYALCDPAECAWMPRCPFRLLTGLQCPGCGAQRFLHALLQGRVGEALAHNYFLIPTLLYLALFLLSRILPPCAARQRLTRIVECRALAAAFLIATVAWFVVRNVLGI